MDVELLRSIVGTELAGRTPDAPLALVTIISTKGSSPRHPGSKMLASSEQNFKGTVGGGKGELIALHRAAEALSKRSSSLIQVEMRGEEATGSAMICGGESTMLVEYIGADAESRAPYRAALDLLEKGRRALLVKKFTESLKNREVSVSVSVFDEDGNLVSGSGGSVDKAKKEAALDKGRTAFDEEAHTFYDPLFPEEKLIIMGAGHVGRALAAAALPLGFKISVIDDRDASVFEGHFPPEAAFIHGSFTEMIEKQPFDRATYAVIMTYGHLNDLECARAALKKPYRYLGMIGSARKTKLILEQLKAEGYNAQQVDAVCAPIGLDIASESPEEIAVSILAEMIAYRRNAACLPRLASERLGRRG